MYDSTAAARLGSRTPIALASSILAVFAGLDLLILAWPAARAVYLRNASAILVVGVGSMAIVTIAAVAAGAKARATRAGREDAIDDLLSSVPGFTLHEAADAALRDSGFVLAGSTGVFVVQLDERRGRVTLDARGVSFAGHPIPAHVYARVARQARAIDRSAHLLIGKRPPVRAVYAFTRASLTAHPTVNGVTFTTYSHLPTLLARSNHMLSAGDLATVRGLLGGFAAPHSASSDTGLFERGRPAEQRSR